MNKKILITISIGVIILAVSLAIVIIYSNSKNIQENKITEDQVSDLPVDVPEIEIPEIDVLRVENIQDSNQIKKSFNDYVSQDHNYRKYKYFEADGISDLFSPSDTKTNLVPLGTFLDSIGANINSRVKSVAGLNYYSLFYCINESKQKEYGIALDLSDKEPEKTKSNYGTAMSAMPEWESYLLKDMHSILFPLDKLGDKDVSQPLSFINGDYRYADVILPAGASSINYKVIGDPLYMIIITTSPKCLSSAMEVFSGLY